MSAPILTTTTTGPTIAANALRCMTISSRCWIPSSCSMASCKMRDGETPATEPWSSRSTGAWDRPVCGPGSAGRCGRGGGRVSLRFHPTPLPRPRMANRIGHVCNPLWARTHRCRQLWYGKRKAEAVWNWAGRADRPNPPGRRGFCVTTTGRRSYAFDGKNFRSYQCDDGYVTCTPTEDFRATLVDHTR